jgi:hypothetical protein
MRLVCLAVLLLATPAAADVGGQSTTTAAFAPDGTVVRLTTAWGKGAKATLQVGKAKATRLHTGETAGALAVGHDKVVVALATDDAEPFQIVVLSENDRGEPVAIARPTDRRDVPFAVAATATPDGFTVFFQEIQSDDPTAAHTYMVKLDTDGAATGAAVEVAVPWSLGAAAWNGKGYHLALFYTESTGMRLSMVSLTDAGHPEQHPDWASKAGFVSDVHLVALDGAITAFYRGGKGGDRLLETDVTKIGQWGQEPPKAKDRGALPLTSSIAITTDGKPTKVKARGR